MFMESKVEKFNRRFRRIGWKNDRFSRSDKSSKEFREELLLAKLQKSKSQQFIFIWGEF